MTVRLFWLVLLSFACALTGGEKTAFSMVLKLETTHPLYYPGDVDAPHPFPFYQNRAKDPIYSPEDACGFGTFLFDPDTNELEYAISYSNLSGRPLMMHFHLGDQKVDGPVIQTIFGYPDKTKVPLGTSASRALNGKKAPKGRSGFVHGKYKLIGNKTLNPPLTPEKEVEALFKGLIYVNIHTYLNEAGEIRGQIIPCH